MKKVFTCQIFDIFESEYKEKKFVQIKSNDWVNILALNDKKELLMIKQYRHGIQSICLETPGGFVDNHEINDPESSAKRELLEETGYKSNDWIFLGSLDPNPAFQTNKCHYFIAKNVFYLQKQKFDEGEEILEIIFKPLDKVYAEIKNHTITHSIVVAGLSLFQNSDYFTL